MNENIPVFKEPNYLGDVVKWEVELNYSRDSVTLSQPADTGLEIGTVLGQTAAGKYVPLDLTASTGEQVAAGILLSRLFKAETAADVKVVIAARCAIVAQDKLVWPQAATDAEITNGLAELKALGIVAREEM